MRSAERGFTFCLTKTAESSGRWGCLVGYTIDQDTIHVEWWSQNCTLPDCDANDLGPTEEVDVPRSAFKEEWFLGFNRGPGITLNFSFPELGNVSLTAKGTIFYEGVIMGRCGGFECSLEHDQSVDNNIDRLKGGNPQALIAVDVYVSGSLGDVTVKEYCRGCNNPSLYWLAPVTGYLI